MRGCARAPQLSQALGGTEGSMSMGMMVAGLVIMFGASLAARLMREKSLQHLSTEQKAQLVDSFSRSRVVHLAALFSVVVIYVLATNMGVSAHDAYLPALILPVVVLMVWSHVTIIRRLRSLAIPDAYVRTFHRARLLSYAGVGVFVLLALFGFAMH